MVKNKGGMYMELRICSCDADIRALAALATEIWHEYFTAIISKEQIDYMVEKFQSYPALKKAIEEENYTYFLAYEEGAMIGFCGVKPEKDRLFLSKLYLHKKARGKGLSSILLKRAISFAREQDKKAIYLQQIQSAQSGCIPCEGLQGYRFCADGYRARLYYG